MKLKWLLSFYVLILEIGTINAQWNKFDTQLLDPNDTGYIGKIVLITPDIGYSVGLNSTTPSVKNKKTVLYKSTDGGNSWFNLGSFTQGALSYGRLGIGFKDTNEIFVSNDVSIFKSVDAGKTWGEVLNKSAESIFVFNDTVICYHSEDSIYVSYNGGQQFQYFQPDKTIIYSSSTNANNASYWNLKFFNGKHGLLFADSSIYETVNSGINWIKIGDTPKMDPNLTEYIYYVNETTFYFSLSTSLWKSTDKALSWREISILPSAPAMHGIYFINAKDGFFSTNDNNLFKTNDSGFTWCNITSINGDKGRINDIKFFNDSLGFAAYISDGMGVFHYASTTNQGGYTCQSTIGVSEVMDKPLKAYPNPFTNTIVIEIPESGFVEISNLLGQVTYTGHFDAGTNNLNAEAFNAGFYIIKATLENGTTLTAKMVKQ